MKASELIKELQKQIDEYSDQDVEIYAEKTFVTIDKLSTHKFCNFISGGFRTYIEGHRI